MKKFFALLLALILVFGLASTVMAGDFSKTSNDKPGTPDYVFDGILVEIGDKRDQCQWLRASLLDEHDTRSGEDSDGEFDGTYVLFNVGSGSTTVEWNVFGQRIFVYVQGNTIMWVNNQPSAPPPNGPTDPVYKIVTRREIDKEEISRELTNVSVLGQVDRVVFQNPNQGNRGSGTGTGFLVSFSATATRLTTFELTITKRDYRVFDDERADEFVEDSERVIIKEVVYTRELTAEAGNGQIHMGGGQNANSGRTLTLSDGDFAVTFTANNSSANRNAVTAVATYNDEVLNQRVPITVTITNHIGNNN